MLINIEIVDPPLGDTFFRRPASSSGPCGATCSGLYIYLSFSLSLSLSIYIYIYIYIYYIHIIHIYIYI